MEKKIIITLSSSIIGSLIILLCIYSIVKTPLYLANLTYDIVQESYDNYGDYENSAYRDIISELDYQCANYLPYRNFSNKDDVSIITAYHKRPFVKITSSTTAEAVYVYERDCIIKSKNSNPSAKSLCTMYWELGEDNVWRVTDFDDPP